MGYICEIFGRLDASNKISEAMYEYLKAFAETRHVERDTEKLKEIDNRWEERTPCGNLGKGNVLYAPGREEYARGSILNNGNSYPTVIPDYYFPLTPHITSGKSRLEELRKSRRGMERRGEIITPSTDAFLNVSLIPFGTDKTYGTEGWIKYLVGCEDIMKYLGGLHGCILILGEEFGDATYVAVSEKDVLVRCAYAENGISMVTDWIEERKDKKALEIFKEVKRTPCELELSWEED